MFEVTGSFLISMLSVFICFFFLARDNTYIVIVLSPSPTSSPINQLCKTFTVAPFFFLSQADKIKLLLLRANLKVENFLIFKVCLRLPLSMLKLNKKKHFAIVSLTEFHLHTCYLDQPLLNYLWFNSADLPPFHS